MENLKFRYLKASEVDVRIGTVKQGSGVSLLLYKDARVDMAILDETVGPYNWQCEYSRDNRNCKVSIWDDEKKQWIGKEDVGVESNSEAEKGLASDSFKRACFKWGIGRELYETPFIWIKGDVDKYAKFKCTVFEVDNGKVVKLEIQKDGKPVYRFKERGSVEQPAKTAATESDPRAMVEEIQMKVEMCESIDDLRELYKYAIEKSYPSRALDIIKARSAKIKESTT